MVLISLLASQDAREEAMRGKTDENDAANDGGNEEGEEEDADGNDDGHDPTVKPDDALTLEDSQVPDIE